MDTRQLRIFRTIYEAGSILAAAERERSAPSVLSHHLVKLEHHLGVPLFDRQSRGVIPTDAGRRLYAHATAILRAMDTAESDMRDTSASVTGRVILGMAFSAVHGVARPLLRAVMDQHPKLHLEIAESVSGASVERLIAAEIDLALAYNPSRDSRLALVPLLEEDLVCLGHRDLLDPAEQPIAFDAFLAMPFMVARKGPNPRTAVDDPDIMKRLEQNTTLFSENVEAAKLFVNSGLGVMLGSRANLDHGAFGPDVVARPFADQRIVRTLHLCERKDAPRSRAAAAIKTLVIDLVRAEIDGGRWQCRPLL